MSSDPLLITAAELAKLLQVSTRTLWRLRSAGQLPEAVRLGGAVRWRLDEIKEWIADGCQSSATIGNGKRKVDGIQPPRAPLPATAIEAGSRPKKLGR
jgi:excisionase family DNA binding protein